MAAANMHELRAGPCVCGPMLKDKAAISADSRCSTAAVVGLVGSDVAAVALGGFGGGAGMGWRTVLEAVMDTPLRATSAWKRGARASRSLAAWTQSSSWACLWVVSLLPGLKAASVRASGPTRGTCRGCTFAASGSVTVARQEDTGKGTSVRVPYVALSPPAAHAPIHCVLVDISIPLMSGVGNSVAAAWRRSTASMILPAGPFSQCLRHNAPPPPHPQPPPPCTHPPAQMDDIEALNFDDLTAVAKLTSEARYSDVLEVGPRGECGEHVGAGGGTWERRRARCPGSSHVWLCEQAALGSSVVGALPLSQTNVAGEEAWC